MIVVVRIPASRGTRWLIDACSRMSTRVARLAIATAAIVTAAVPVGTREAVVAIRRPQPPVSRADQRVERLRAFFQAYRCQEPHHVQEYLRAADVYGLDYRLLPAISIRETTCGWTEQDNNWWGYHPGRQIFPSVEAGIDFVARRLAKEPPYAGKSLREKLYTYNPRPAYPVEVERIMRQIE